VQIGKLKATSCATTCIVVPTDDSFLCNFQKSDQTSKEHKRKTLLEKNKKELTCNLPNTPGEIVSFLITLAIRVLSHAFDRIAQLLTGMSCTSASRYSICSSPKTKEKPSSVIVMSISANYNCTERTITDGKVVVFTNHQVIQAAADSLLLLVHVPESFINVFCYKEADVCVL
jgi:hypothetical protein